MTLPRRCSVAGNHAERALCHRCLCGRTSEEAGELTVPECTAAHANRQSAEEKPCACWGGPAAPPSGRSLGR